jgi:3-oxoacyl-[acyl-carrier-protein] synthase-3
MTQAAICAIEYALPSREITNAEFDRAHPEWHMREVECRTGVETRYWCAPCETSLDLAEAACRKLKERQDLSQVDALLFCTQTPDYLMPPNAGLLQSRLGFSRCMAALDYTLACSGFVHGLYLADALVRSQAARNVLLVTAETYSKLISADDRGPATLFGDGAAATLVIPGELGIGHFALASDGANAQCFMVPAGGARSPRSAETAQPRRDDHGNIRSAEQIFMNGAHVLDFFKREVPLLVTRLLTEATLTMKDIDLVVLHQASAIAIDMIYHLLRVPAEKQFSNLRRIGNTVSASIPIALRDAERAGVLRPGMHVLLVGFGVGLSWSACIVTWQ